MFRIDVAIVMFLVWVFLFLATVETKAPMFEIMMPVIMIILVCYLFAWSIYVFLSRGKQCDGGTKETYKDKDS